MLILCLICHILYMHSYYHLFTFDALLSSGLNLGNVFPCLGHDEKNSICKVRRIFECVNFRTQCSFIRVKEAEK